jgi:anti-sigma factor RsiW
MQALTCRELSEFLADYLADELGPDERLRFEEHLAECPECVAYLRSYAETRQLVKDAFEDGPLPPPPEELVRAILAARDGRLC